MPIIAGLVADKYFRFCSMNASSLRASSRLPDFKTPSLLAPESAHGQLRESRIGGEHAQESQLLLWLRRSRGSI